MTGVVAREHFAIAHKQKNHHFKKGHAFTDEELKFLEPHADALLRDRLICEAGKENEVSSGDEGDGAPGSDPGSPDPQQIPADEPFPMPEDEEQEG